jgi:1-acyl-sn-glycerol-3-phosphate acyltransferase
MATPIAGRLAKVRERKPEALGSPLLGIGRIVVYAVFTLALMPVQFVLVLLHLPQADHLPFWYHRRVCRILGLKLEIYGKRRRKRPTLYVANHLSYLDIEVLGALIPGSFVAKAEMANWPFFGWLAKLQRTVFVGRKLKDAKDNADSITGRVARGGNLILFPEGTSGDGNRLVPFKSALLSVAQVEDAGGAPVTVQPVMIAYTRLDGVPVGRALRPLYCWYGDMELAPHIWEFVKLGKTTVVVAFLEPVTIRDFSSRKELARHLEHEIGVAMAAANNGRLEELPPRMRRPLIPRPRRKPAKETEAEAT